MPSLSAHLRNRETHARLPFHPDCPACRDERLLGDVAPHAAVSQRARAAVAAAALAVTTMGPAAALATEPASEWEARGSRPGRAPSTSRHPATARMSPCSIRARARPTCPRTRRRTTTMTRSQTTTPRSTTPTHLLSSMMTPPARWTLTTSPRTRLRPNRNRPDRPNPRRRRRHSRRPQRRRPIRRRRRSRHSSHLRLPRAPRPVRLRHGLLSSGIAPGRARAAQVPRSAPAQPDTTAQAAAPAPTPRPPTSSTAPPADHADHTDRTHTVQAGESLWSIAADVLGPSARPFQIAREVHRLWELNKERIATGNPDLLMIDTRLRLR